MDTSKKDAKKSLNGNLKQLAEITAWFDGQKEVDVEEGIKKVKEAAALIKASRERLKAVENEFEEIKKEISFEDEEKTEAEF
ncbi:MAG: exodeoxyribonuclease VII small subunit [Candidatus Pacebacteria bacterium]|nr:exodeoxyribonuclease VII small subunit [Candidatus Paceibacterota bacterium]